MEIIIGLAIICGLMICILVPYLLQLKTDIDRRKMEFELRMESAKQSVGARISQLSYKDLLTIVDTNMLYYVDQSILESGIGNKRSDEERSLIFNEILTSTCVLIETSLSEYVISGLLCYISKQHLQVYIKDRTRILLIAKIEQIVINENKK